MSGIFIPLGDNAPAWIRDVGRVFPVKHFFEAMLAGFYGAPFRFAWSDVNPTASTTFG